MHQLHILYIEEGYKGIDRKSTGPYNTNMKSYTFRGGVHPPERKELSNTCSITNIVPSSHIVVIPITQGGTPNKPLVSPGDTVVKGQKIAESDTYMSVPVHASISGTVKKIEPRLIAGNTEAPCVIIEADGSDTVQTMDVLDPFACTRQEALTRIRSAGIVGMGGAAFPAHVKLNPPPEKKIDYVLVNAAECEPYLTVDERILAEETAKVIDGLAIVMHITNAPEGLICLEDNKKYLIPTIEKAIAASGKEHIAIRLCRTKYPQGGEKMLIKAAVGREVPSGGLPADAGCVVHNAGTLCAVSEAFREGKALTERALTISGMGCQSPCNIRVPIGTIIADLIPEVFQISEDTKKIISGGPMMGITMMNTQFPVAKNTSGVLFLTEKETELTDESPCIGCGRCIDVCPCRLPPVLMMRALKADELQNAVKIGLMDCIECGACSYICPARVKLVQRFRVGKMQERTELQRQKLAAARAAEAAKGGN